VTDVISPVGGVLTGGGSVPPDGRSRSIPLARISERVARRENLDGRG
jgi:hypothetical protein